MIGLRLGLEFQKRSGGFLSQRVHESERALLRESLKSGAFSRDFNQTWHQ